MLPWVVFLSLLLVPVGGSEMLVSKSGATMRYRGIERLLAKFTQDVTTAKSARSGDQNR